MRPDDTPVMHWQSALEHAVADLSFLQRVTVLDETDSTQDAARRMNLKPGHLVVAGRQTAGRGRLGRRWVDTGDDGVALSFLCPSDEGGGLAIRAAVGVAFGVERSLGRLVQLKWPNDIFIEGRKLAGILIEASGGIATVGIGINVHQTAWDPSLEDRAVSLRQVGVEADRLLVIRNLLTGLDTAWKLADSQVEADFLRRDLLVGTQAAFLSAGDRVEGIVRRIDPVRGIEVATPAGIRWLSGATTSVIPDLDSP